MKTDEEIVKDKVGEILRLVPEGWMRPVGVFIGKIHVSTFNSIEASVYREGELRDTLIPSYVAAIAESRRQLPVESPVDISEIQKAIAVKKEWFGVWQSTHPLKAHYPELLLAHIDHLERLVAFLSNEPEGENARELLTLAYEQGKRDSQP